MTVLAEPPYYGRSALPQRPPYSWPQDASLALGFVVSIESWELAPPHDALVPANVPGAFGRGPYPDLGTYSRREYGNRIGIFRVMRMLTAYGWRATAAIDAITSKNCPPILRECQRLGWEVAAHGIAATRILSSAMSNDEEGRYIDASLKAIEDASGTRPCGWHSPEYAESAETPALLAQRGLGYVLDWPNDEQPVEMRTAHGALVSLPMSLELDDVYAHWQRRLSMASWRDAIIDAIDQLSKSSPKQGRLLLLNLHPWLIGHPYRITYLREILEHVQRCSGIWGGTAGEIFEWHRSQATAR